MNESENRVIEEMNRLSEQLRIMQREYYVTGNPSQSDQRYDLMFDRLLALEEKYPHLRAPDSPTQRVGSDLTSDLPEVAHTIPVLSLDKAYSAEAVSAWMRKLESQAAQTLSFVVEEKIDGISIVLYYERGVLVRAVTRGNGFVGNDVTANVRTIGSVPLRLSEPVDIAVRGEIYLPKEAFCKLNSAMETAYANPRNLAAGTIRRIRSSDVAKVPLRIFVYEGFFQDDSRQPETHTELLDYLRLLGFRLNPRVFVCTSGDALGSYIERSALERKDLPYEIDGLVVKVNQLKIREVLGYTGHHPRWAIAYKFEAPLAETVVEAIDVQVGRTGRITPVARVVPVKIGGSTVSNVTLHNQDYIEMLELAIGDKVTISKRGDVIPAVEQVVEKNDEGNSTWRLPDVCPSCGSRLQKQGAHHFCRNSQCPDQVYGRLVFFVGKGQMDIDGLGAETIAVLLRKGMVHDIPDLYSLDYSLLEDEPGFGPKKIQLLKQGIEESRKRPFSTVLRSLGIPELGKKAVELLISNGITSVDRLIEIARLQQTEQIVSIKGFGEKTAETILREFSDDRVIERVRRLREAGLRFTEEVREKTENSTLFAGQVWCVTGSFEHFKPRSRATDEIEARGGRTVSSVTGKTTHLLAGSGAGSKLQKAQSLGVEIVSEEEFLRRIGS